MKAPDRLLQWIAKLNLIDHKSYLTIFDYIGSFTSDWINCRTCCSRYCHLVTHTVGSSVLAYVLQTMWRLHERTSHCLEFRKESERDRERVKYRLAICRFNNCGIADYWLPHSPSIVHSNTLKKWNDDNDIVLSYNRCRFTLWRIENFFCLTIIHAVHTFNKIITQ